MQVIVKISRHEEIHMTKVKSIRNLGGLFRLITKEDEELFLKPNTLMAIEDD